MSLFENQSSSFDSFEGVRSVESERFFPFGVFAFCGATVDEELVVGGTVVVGVGVVVDGGEVVEVVVDVVVVVTTGRRG